MNSEQGIESATVPRPTGWRTLARRSVERGYRNQPGRVEQLLRWSPEQIQHAGQAYRSAMKGFTSMSSRGGSPSSRCQKPRRKRYGHYDRRGQIRERVPIENGRGGRGAQRSSTTHWCPGPVLVTRRSATTSQARCGYTPVSHMTGRRVRMLPWDPLWRLRHRLQQTDGQAGPGDHGQVEQSPSKMPTGDYPASSPILSNLH